MELGGTNKAISDARSEPKKTLYLSSNFTLPDTIAALSVPAKTPPACTCHHILLKKAHTATASRWHATVSAKESVEKTEGQGLQVEKMNDDNKDQPKKLLRKSIRDTLDRHAHLQCPLEVMGAQLAGEERVVSPEKIVTTFTRAFGKTAMEAIEPAVHHLRHVDVKREISFSDSNRLLCRYIALIQRLKKRGEAVPAELYLRRSTLFALLEQYEEARDDAEAALKAARGILPVAFFRVGCAEFGMKNYAAAAIAFHDGLRQSPGSQDLKHALEVALKAIRHKRYRQY